MRAVTTIVLCLLCAGCATELTPEASRVRVATATEKPACQSLGIISTEQRVEPGKAGNAMNKALNATAERGGNAIFPISGATDWAEGASVTVEALKCPS